MLQEVEKTKENNDQNTQPQHKTTKINNWANLQIRNCLNFTQKGGRGLEAGFLERFLHLPKNKQRYSFLRLILVPARYRWCRAVLEFLLQQEIFFR